MTANGNLMSSFKNAFRYFMDKYVYFSIKENYHLAHFETQE